MIKFKIQRISDELNKMAMNDGKDGKDGKDGNDWKDGKDRKDGKDID